MSRRPLLGACCVGALCLAAAFALLDGGRLGSTFALFNSETKNASSGYADGWLTAPASLAGTPSGNNVSLTWTVSAHPASSSPGQQVYYDDVGTGTTCQTGTTSLTTATTLAASYTSSTTIANNTTAAYSDTGRTAGDHVCYAVTATAGTAWTSPASWFGPIVVGFYPTTVVLANGTTGGTLANNDTIAATFNQPPATPASTRVCTWATSKTILVGDTTGSCGAVGDSAAFKVVSSTTMANNGSYTASYNITGNTLTVKINSSPTTKTTVSGTPTWTFTPGVVASATGAATVCTTTACHATPTGNV